MEERIDNVKRYLESLGNDVKMSTGRRIPNGKTSICASSDSTNFSKKLVEIEGIVANNGMRINKIENHFLDLSDY